MPSIQVIRDQREPNTVQLFATQIDAAVACFGGATQSTWWLPVDTARKLHAYLGLTLGTEGGESSGDDK
jgi:hypothetical protein